MVSTAKRKSPYVDYDTWISQALSCVELPGGQTVWRCGAVGKQPLVLVHGTSGDRFGVVPLAYELAGRYDIFIIELLGHGSRAIPDSPAYTLDSLRQDLRAQILDIEGLVGCEAGVVAHSFGCLVAGADDIASTRKVLLITPVPELGRLFFVFATLFKYTVPVTARIYNLPFFDWMRREVIARDRFDRAARRRLIWNSKVSSPTVSQTDYQIRLMDAIYRANRRPDSMRFVDAVLLVNRDTASSYRTPESYSKIFPSAYIEMCEGGHLVPIEQPARVAAIVDGIMTTQQLE